VEMKEKSIDMEEQPALLAEQTVNSLIGSAGSFLFPTSPHERTINVKGLKV